MNWQSGSAATHTMLVPVQYQRILSAKLPSPKSRQLPGQAMHERPAGEVRQARDRPPLAGSLPRGLRTDGGRLHLHPRRHRFSRQDGHSRQARAGQRYPHHRRSGDGTAGRNSGEIIGRSRTMMSGYFRNEAANAAFRWHNAEGLVFHRTGDIGMFDADGFLTLLTARRMSSSPAASTSTPPTLRESWSSIRRSRKSR